MSAAAQLDQWFQGVGSWSYVILFASAWVEYLVPIFPGDTVTLLGGVYAARGERPWLLVLAATTLGSVLGSACDYWIGLRLGQRVSSQRGFFRFKGPSPERLARLQDQMRRRGTVLLLCNRFLPGIRPIFFIAAGASQMSLARVLTLGAISALLWNGGVIALGMLLGGSVEEVAGFMKRYSLGVWVVLILVALAVMLRLMLRRRSVSAPRA